MSRKKILIFSGGSIFPIGGMHQVRIFNQVKTLSREHDIDLMFLYNKKHHRDLTIQGIKEFCRKVIPHKTPTQSFTFRLLKKLFLTRLFDLFAYPLDYFTLSNSISARQIAGKIVKENYQVIISHYWQASGFLEFVKEDVYKCIDTHYLVEENLELYQEGMYDHINNDNMGKLLRKELAIQTRVFNYAKLLIVNSEKQKIILDSTTKFNSICIRNGQDLDHYFNYSQGIKDNTQNILFYGSLSNQFNQRAIKRILDRMWPLIKAKHFNARLIIMGAGPPECLSDMVMKDSSIEVTGYIEDVRKVFENCTLALIPLESGSGFRGRVIELLASGVPVIGTLNALQSVGIENEIISIHFWEDLFAEPKPQPVNKFTIPVVIMAGGLGTRLKPLTNVLPKPLFPVGETTMLEEIMYRFAKHGCSDFYISLNYKAELIEFYIKEHQDNYNVNFFRENKPLGTCGCLYMLSDIIKQTFFVSNCDILIEQDYSELLSYHHKNLNEITIVAALKHYPISYGTIETGENGKLIQLIEKPELTFKINSGMYILEPHLLNELPKNQFYHITQLIDKVKTRGGKVGVFPVSEKSWKDIGDWKLFLKENQINTE